MLLPFRGRTRRPQHGLQCPQSVRDSLLRQWRARKPRAQFAECRVVELFVYTNHPFVVPRAPFSPRRFSPQITAHSPVGISDGATSGLREVHQ